MIPPLIVQKALEKGIGIIAITDHNASANVAAVRKAAGQDLVVLPGMELQTREEVHLLCLFQELDGLLEWQRLVDSRLPDRFNRPDVFGEQFIVDESGDFIRREDRLLATSADISLDEAAREVSRRGGLAIPAHVDRKAFSLIANLGFIPEGAWIEAVEISRNMNPERVDQVFPQLKGIPRIQSGDVHRLDDFLGVNELVLEAPTLPEIRLALKNQGGRAHKISKASN